MARKKVRKVKVGAELTNIEDSEFIIKVTKDFDPSKESFEGVVVSGGRHHRVGEHSMFWLKSRFN
jgi:hypothetical protein